MCDEAVACNPRMLWCIPDQYKTQKMCDKAVEAGPFRPCYLASVPDRFKTEEMCIKAVEAGLWLMYHVPGHLKMQEMCDKAVRDDHSSLQYVPDWFVTQQQLKLWHVYDDFYKRTEWDDGYQKRKTQKASIKEELLPIAWHPSRWWDWCVPEDKKKETEKLFLTI